MAKGLALAAIASLQLVPQPAGAGRSGVTRIISANNFQGGQQGDKQSDFPSISDDGRFVAFQSHANNLADDDGDGNYLEETDSDADIFVKDMQPDYPERYLVVKRASRSSSGAQANNVSDHPSISGDGFRVVFSSEATNLIDGRSISSIQVYVHYLNTRVTELVSAITGTSSEPNGKSDEPAISADGRYVAFTSEATNLVSDEFDNNLAPDVFVRDLNTGRVTRQSKTLNGELGDGGSSQPSISGRGGYVAFVTEATGFDGLVPDTNGVADVFMRDTGNGRLTRVSVGPGGQQSDKASYQPAISSNETLPIMVAFATDATNLVYSGGLPVGLPEPLASLLKSDTNAEPDVYIRDIARRVTQLVSATDGGRSGNGKSLDPVLSSDGSAVAFSSSATDLLPATYEYDATLSLPSYPPKASNHSNIYVRNLAGQYTTRSSETSDGKEANQGSLYPSISANGRFVAFQSSATNLLINDSNGPTAFDVFRRDRFVCANGTPEDGPVSGPVHDGAGPVQPEFGPSGPVVHETNCRHVVGNDL